MSYKERIVFVFIVDTLNTSVTSDDSCNFKSSFIPISVISTGVPEQLGSQTCGTGYNSVEKKTENIFINLFRDFEDEGIEKSLS
jgi:hypothetical protein